MKISTLLETITPSSSTDNTNTSAPKFGRSDKFLEEKEETVEECTTAGSVASVAQPVGKMQRRGKGSIFNGIKTSEKFPNSRTVKEGAYQDGVNDGIRGEANPRASSIYGPESGEYSRGYEDGLVKGKEQHQANIEKYRAELAPYKEIETDELKQMLRDIRKRIDARQAIFDKYRGSSRFGGGMPPNVEELKKEGAIDSKAWQAIHQELFQRGVPQEQRMEESSPMGTFAALKGLKTWQVVIFNNYYAGKYTDYRGRYYYVLATSPQEARQVVLDNADGILQDLLSMKSHNGKKILPRGTAVRITPDHIGKVEDGTVEGRMTTAGFKKMFGPEGQVMVKLSGGNVVDMQDVNPEGVTEADEWEEDTEKRERFIQYAKQKLITAKKNNQGNLIDLANALSAQDNKIFGSPFIDTDVHVGLGAVNVSRGEKFTKAISNIMNWLNSSQGVGQVAAQQAAVWLQPHGKEFLERVHSDLLGMQDNTVEARQKHAIALSGYQVEHLGGKVRGSYKGDSPSEPRDMMTQEVYDIFNVVEMEIGKIKNQQLYDKDIAERKKIWDAIPMPIKETIAAEHNMNPEQFEAMLFGETDADKIAGYYNNQQAQPGREEELAEANPFLQQHGYGGGKFPEPRKPLPGQIPSKSEVLGKDGLIYHWQDPRAKGVAEAKKANTKTARAEFGKRIKAKPSEKEQEQKKSESDAAWERLMAYAAAQKKEQVDEAEISEEMLASDLYKDLQIFKQSKNKDISGKAKSKDLSKKPTDKEIIAKVAKITKEDKDPCWKGYKQIGMKDKAGKKVPNCVPVKEEVSEDWQKVNKSDKTDGMSPKAVKAYRRENPGSKLKTAVTTKPSKLKAGSKDAKRRKSFCARMSGVEGPMKDEHGEPTAKAKALKRWNC